MCVNLQPAHQAATLPLAPVKLHLPFSGQSQDTQMKLINSVTGYITNLAQGCNAGRHNLNLHPILVQSSRH